jgi:arylsulfatase A-like enzyme
MMNSENGWSIEEAGMAQLDDDVGLVMQHLKDAGLDDNTIVVFTTDNGTETFTWPDGGTTPFAQAKGTIMEGALPRAMHHPLARPCRAGFRSEWHYVRLGLAPHVRLFGRKPEHHPAIA